MKESEEWQRNVNFGTHPCWMASFMNPNLFAKEFNNEVETKASRKSRPDLLRSVRSAVPGCALRLSAAPPTTMVIAEPGPLLRIFEHDCLLTLHTPNARSISR